MVWTDLHADETIRNSASRNGIPVATCFFVQSKTDTTMNIPIQIDTVSIARATNAAHYEYLDTVRKHTGETWLGNELWQRVVEELLTSLD